MQICLPSPTDRLFSCSRKCQSCLDPKRSWPLGTSSYWALFSYGSNLQLCAVHLSPTFLMSCQSGHETQIRVSDTRGTAGLRYTCYITLQLSIPNKTQQFKAAGSDCLVRKLTANPGFPCIMTGITTLPGRLRTSGHPPLKGSLVLEREL